MVCSRLCQLSCHTKLSVCLKRRVVARKKRYIYLQQYGRGISYPMSKHVALRLVGRGTDDEGHRSQREGVLARAGGYGPQHALERHEPHRTHHLRTLLSQLWIRTRGRSGVEELAGFRASRRERQTNRNEKTTNKPAQPMKQPFN